MNEKNTNKQNTLQGYEMTIIRYCDVYRRIPYIFYKHCNIE